VQQIRAAGLVPAVDKATNASVDQGKVFKQDPTAGSKIDKGGTVTLTVSTGPKKVPVPDVKGEQWSAAQAALVNAGFKPQKFSVPGTTAGQVTATDPPAGTSLAVGSKIRVNVMSGPVTAAVPSVVGLSIQDATAKLNDAGFKANPQYTDSTAPKDQVLSQTPAAGSPEPKGTSVTLKVSLGPPQVTVPSVVGYTSQQAVQALEAQGFQVNEQYTQTGAAGDNIVQTQNPDGGSQAPKGSTVTITIGQHSPGPPPPPTTTTTTP
jgi:eukaryotic-like serine/threonine-protein kinase